jgi:hypothetical protein
MNKIGYLLVFITIILAGCNSAEEIEPDYPFEMQYILGEGRVIGFSGNAAGHMPGQETEFVVTLMNNGTEVWNDRYFIQLADEIAVVTTLYEAPIAIGPASAEVFPVAITFPDYLEQKAYGLTVFIPDRMAAVTNIYLGVSYYLLPDITRWAEPEVP